MNKISTNNQVIKKFANAYGYSDVDPYEVIEERTPNCYVIRSMNAEETAESVKKRTASFVPGGFCGHFDNHCQEWNITPDENGVILRIRRHKDGKFYDRNGRRYGISDKPIKFYDFNF